MNTALENRSVPKLRFSGFYEDWEKKKIGEVLKYYDGCLLYTSDAADE